MNFQQTPIKRKLHQFHSQIKSEYVQDLQRSVRQKNLRSQKKSAQEKRFKGYCTNLDVNPLDEDIINQLITFCHDQKFIITEKYCQYLTPIISKLFEIYERSAHMKKISQQQKEKPLKCFGKLIYILVKQTRQFPNYCNYEHPKTLSLILDILQNSTHKKIRDLTLQWICMISRNNSSKLYLLENKLLQKLSKPQFQTFFDNIEVLLSVIFDYDEVKLSQCILEQIFNLLKSNKNIFSSFQECRLELLYNFVNNLKQRVQNSFQLKNLNFFVDVLIIILKKCQEYPLHQIEYISCYSRILFQTSKGLIDFEYFQNDKKQIILRNLEKITFAIRDIVEPKYFQLIKKIISFNEQELKPYQKQKQELEKIIQGFTEYLTFTIKRFKNEQILCTIAQDYLQNLYSIWKSENSTFFFQCCQFRLLIKFYHNFSDQDIQNIMFWYQYTLDDIQCRHQSLIKLRILRQLQKISSLDWKRLQNIYERQSIRFQQKNDPLTQFIFNQQSHLSEQQIRKKDKCIEQERRYQLNKYDEENKDFLLSIKKKEIKQNSEDKHL